MMRGSCATLSANEVWLRICFAIRCRAAATFSHLRLSKLLQVFLALLVLLASAEPNFGSMGVGGWRIRLLPSAPLDTVSRGRDRASVRKWHAPCAISKLESGQSPTSSRQGVWVCGALRLPHDLICLPLLFPQNSLRDFCGNPERQESAFSPSKREARERRVPHLK